MYISSGKERCEVLASYMIENHATVRLTAAYFGISKSTVHKDITYNLKKVNAQLYKSVKALLEKNKKERHIRGGEATKLKYQKMHI
jgi:putative DeoR family transcriptional regulator (stage III sporulation protein D)